MQTLNEMTRLKTLKTLAEVLIKFDPFHNHMFVAASQDTMAEQVWFANTTFWQTKLP